MSRPFTPSSASGYSILELTMAMGVGLSVLAGALALALSSRGIYETDQARTRLHENLRSSREFLVTDIRQAGERLGRFPAIEIIRGEDLPGGSAGDPDELIVRRNLLDDVLPVCQDVDPLLDDVIIAVKTAPPTGCAPLPVDPGDTLPTNLERWADHRTDGGGTVLAYIFNRANQIGEFFTFESEGEDPNGFFVSKAAGSPAWQFAYPQAERCQVFILEERRYRLQNGILQMIVNGDTADPVNLVDTIEDFQLLAFPAPTPADPTPAPWDSLSHNAWLRMRGIHVTVSGSVEVRGRSIRHDWSTTILPRNVL